jgi:hypothetical protein
MAKVAYVCLKNDALERRAALRRTLEDMALRLCPDNIRPTPPRIVEQSGILAAVFSPNDSVQVSGASICAGHLTSDGQWESPNSGTPEGAFALFRADRSSVEIISDAVASRNIWYYFDETMLIAATTERAIVALLGTFEPNPSAIPWMLATGTLGPVSGWDRRVRRVGPDTVLALNRASWRLSLKTSPIAFVGDSKTKAPELDSFLRCLQSTFATMRFDYGKWVLPLSGGYDSRGILCLLPDKSGMRTITWGLEASLRQPGNDAVVAQKVAAALGVRHEYRVTDRADEPIPRLFERFVVAGEGYVDHISGYMDGFAIWKSLYEEGIEGVIRGDEGFGWHRVQSAADVLRVNGISFWRDDPNLPSLESLGLPEQTLPEELQRQAPESLAQWRDRLYHQYRIPNVLAALNDLKLSYVEVANPLLSRPILNFVRSMSDEQRTEKHAFRGIVSSIGPPVPIATSTANAELGSIFKTPDVVALLRETLASRAAGRVMPHSLLELLDRHLVQQSEPARTRGAARVRGRFGRLVRRALRIGPSGSVATDYNRMAFDAYLITRMHELMTEDTDLGHHARTPLGRDPSRQSQSNADR